jgi:fluoroquinolone resistance protein
MINNSSSPEIWNRLLQGKSLDGLSLETKDGRINLRGLALPDPSVIRKYQMANSTVWEIEPAAVFRRVKWQDLDFSSSKLNGIRLFDCEIRNCLFEKSQLKDLRVWSTVVTESSFIGADLRKAALGGVQDGKRNTYLNVDFSEADLRETAYRAASFERCVFRNTKLVNVDFQTSTFTDCVFEGELRDVLFYRRGFNGEAFPPNEMVNVDFSRAILRDVGFRGLSLDRVRLPEDSEHILIKNFVSALDKAIDALKGQEDGTARKLVAFLEICRKWAPPNQVQGIINIQDLTEVAGEVGVRNLIAALPK